MAASDEWLENLFTKPAPKFWRKQLEFSLLPTGKFFPARAEKISCFFILLGPYCASRVASIFVFDTLSPRRVPLVTGLVRHGRLRDTGEPRGSQLLIYMVRVILG